ncbi:DUF934 domain-containing protein [Pararhodobacter oceanensis]|uniref:Oxidoreductase n=1 Tax=Pararhodobacter oceanensis TaxID=2172121 RepID=A0A2T8HRS7_9RHOB|nr:DUF934 domain-containing protein [Pararhodobacter oceanensis]PVH28130.1 oxidoreductase [Pararhodobacter oceanensis]
MSIIVTDSGFAPDGFNGTWFDLAPDVDLEALEGQLAETSAIRISFGSFADGRGFSLASWLRAKGFEGRLRACGHVLADQYAMARRSGFDEVEIDEALAARQPAEHWRARADWQTHDYRKRLRRSA